MAADLFSLEDKVAFITGGNSGLGCAIALAFGRAGALVAIDGRRAERNACVLASLGRSAAAFELDVADEGSVERALAGTVEWFGRIDILVNNAGVGQRTSVMDLTAPPSNTLSTPTSPARSYKTQGAGKIINISSIYGVIAPSKGLQVAYTVTKHAVIGLTKVNAVELAPLNIQVNAIVPGWYFTEMTEELRGTAFEQSVVRRTPAGRWGDAPDLVGTCLYLASAASNYVSGAVITVDGGYTASDGLERN
jgi:2-dehydro-3-deoxy-D-gluconate 5-dehydrogenase